MATSMATASKGLAALSSGAPQYQKDRGFISQIGQAVYSVAQTFVSWFDALAAAQQASRRYEYLTRLSDAELVAFGIKRQDIPHYVIERMHNRST